MTDARAIELVMTLRKQGITDTRVLSAIETIPRDAFVDQPFEMNAYDNSALPIACGQTISQPYVVAFATQALEIDPKHRVLELGTGSGYQAAILSPLCRMVYTVERHKPLLAQAEERFKKIQLRNIVTRHGDGLKGWPEAAPFDRILLSAAVSEIPQGLIDQLKPAGILIAPVGGDAQSARGVSQSLTKIVKSEHGIERENLLPVMFVPMIEGLPQSARAPDARGTLKRIAALALCVLGAAMLSGCETYQDARESYADFYGRPAPRDTRVARSERHYAPAAAPTTRVAVREDDDITPRRRPAYVPPRQDYAQQDMRAGDNLTSGFVMPVSGTVIAGFGSTGGGQRNDGINIAAASGTPIHAAADGVVTYAGNELKGYGNLILIKHGDTYVTAYAHTNSIGVARGQRVAKGDVIGTVGQTGDVSRPQLHFEIRRNMKPIDPRAILTASNDS